MVETNYDPKADVLSVRFTATRVSESEEARPDVVLDYDAHGRIVSMAILKASEHAAHGVDLGGRVSAQSEERRQPREKRRARR